MTSISIDNVDKAKVTVFDHICYFTIWIDDLTLIDVPEPIAKAFADHYKVEIKKDSK